jgi:tRNA dimethylallyltransferase
MQVYSVLNVITARPTAADLERVPHALYGHVHPSVAYSTGAWLRDVSRIVGEGRLTGRTPIFVGGTGLYFRALVDGISRMPEIPGIVRERWRRQLDESGPQELHRILQRDDPAAALTLKSGDGQRIVRALEVLEASGRSILEWQKGDGVPLTGNRWSSASRSGSCAWSERARSKRSRRSWRLGSTRRCRP